MADSKQSNILSLADYVILGLMLLVSVAIGLYHALLSGGRQRSTHEYFLGNRQLGAFPVGISVFISFISAVSFLGTPAEIYLHGPTYWLVSLSVLLSGAVVTRTFIPKFYRLQLTSIYEYLELRFNKMVRYSVVTISVLFGFVYIAFVIYAPSLALSAVTGISMSSSILTIGLVCTFYTTIGGIKAVIWADVFQAFVMIIGLIVTMVMGCIRVGGIEEVWRRAERGGRTELIDFSIDPRIRHTFFSIMFGGTFQSIFSLGTNQLISQRYLSCESERAASMAGWIGIVLISAFQFLVSFSGIIIYAFYADCDPVLEGRIQIHDQIVPLFIVDIVKDVPGLSGLLISAVFSASLSTVSSGMNAVAANAAEDFIKPNFSYESDRQLTIITKIIAAVCGLIAVALAFLAPLLGSILEAVLGLIGILSGPVLGVFSLGFFVPWCNSVGAMVGFVLGSISGVLIAFGSKLFPMPLDDPPLVCDNPFVTNYTSAMSDMTTLTYFTTLPDELSTEGNSDFLFISNVSNISYMYYGCFATLITVFTGFLVSLITGPTDPRTLDPMLFCRISDVYCCCCPTKCRETCCCPSLGTKIEKSTSIQKLENGFAVTEEFAFDNPVYANLNEETRDTRL